MAQPARTDAGIIRAKLARCHLFANNMIKVSDESYRDAFAWLASVIEKLSGAFEDADFEGRDAALAALAAEAERPVAIEKDNMDDIEHIKCLISHHNKFLLDVDAFCNMGAHRAA